MKERVNDKMFVWQVVIQGTVGGGVHNDIAIDDLSLTPGCQVGGK